MAITKKRRAELVAEYADLLKRSEALIIASYSGVRVKNVEQLRRKVREASGELHVVKNTLATVALKAAGMPVPEEFLHGDTAIGFAFKDVPAVAKAIQDFTKESEFVKVKGGVMSGKILSAKEIAALASLPPMPVVRAQLLGLINTPATRIAGSIASAVRQLVNVTKAYADKGAEQAA